MNTRNIRFYLLNISLLFLFIWIGSYYYGQKDTGRVFGVLGLLISSITHLLVKESKWVRYTLFLLRLGSTILIFMCAQKYYGT